MKWIFIFLFVIGIAVMLQPLLLMVSTWILKRQAFRFYEYRRSNKRVPLDLSRLPGMPQLQLYMSIAEVRGSPIIYSALALTIGALAVISINILMQSMLNSLFIGLMFGSSPFIYIWLCYQHKQQQMASCMIPAVQTFIGFFTESENLLSALYKCSVQMPREIQREWQRLVMDVQTGEPAEPALIRFAERVGNHWAHDFVDILIIHVDTGCDVIPSLFKLINEMQNAMYNEEKRVTLLSIYRWGTLLMIALAIFIVGFNVWIHPSNKYYYFTDPSGKKFVTISVIVLFISFITALQMGKRKI